MEVTSRMLREVEFRDQLRGYNHDDVDEFLERVAEGIDALQERLRQAIERANRAEQRANSVAKAQQSAPPAPVAEPGLDDDTLKRTLLLAQRTADMAIKEAHEKAEKILVTAQAEARSGVTNAEDSGRRIKEESARQVKAELTRLEETRAQLQAEVEALERHFANERSQIYDAFSKALRYLDDNVPIPTLSSFGSGGFGGSSNLALDSGDDPLESGLNGGEIGSRRSREAEASA